MNLNEKLEAVKREHANAMDQASKWNLRAQRSAGAIEVLEQLIVEDSASTDKNEESPN